ncbi:MAG TPA: YabP/YqfC family sporulation protein [Halanaerobiales bacterium]|nr:YabP/YqfC family sporulation protein [Halanaerobiales bacterium]
MGRLKKQFVEVFDLSPEVVLDLPLLMFIGNQNLFIENHKGVRYYHDNQIIIKVSDKYIIIEGQALVIDEINSDNLFISGSINSISYKDGNGGEKS